MTNPLSRREFAARGAAALLPLDIPIIDAHIHLFDPRRPQGVPWPPKDDPVLYKPALPARYRSIAAPLGIVGAIEIEASPWLEDNQWVLDIAATNPIIVATVGHLEPGERDFPSQLKRFRRNKLFRGILYGNLWGRSLGDRLAEPAFVADLKTLASEDLELDTANPDTALIEAVVRLSDEVPNLRIVIDHLPHLEAPSDRSAREAYEANLRLLSQRQQVYVKISQVLQRVNGRVSLDPVTYRSKLDHLWQLFGEDRLLYGSDWPNSDPWGTYANVLDVVRTYVMPKGRAAAEKFFWKNSVAAYRWVPRNAMQPHVSAS